jgi:hypothetical protein
MAIKKICPVLIRIASTNAVDLAKPVHLVILIRAAFPVAYMGILNPGQRVYKIEFRHQRIFTVRAAGHGQIHVL